VTLSDGTEYSAQLIGRDPDTDIAIIKIDATGLTAAEFGTSGDLQVGDIAIAIGNPLGTLAGSVTQGIISATEREITIDNTKMNVLQFDAAINQGNSGGALVNDKGQLVGVVNAKSFAVGVEGLGFAIPIDDVREIIDAIVSGTPLGTGIARLGVTTRTVTQEISDMYDVPVGAYVTEVEAFSAAERAGIKVGDVITSFAGQDVTKNEDLSTIRDQHEIGDVLEVTINRNGEEMTLELTLLEGMKTF
jgi:serine protease Do